MAEKKDKGVLRAEKKLEKAKKKEEKKKKYLEAGDDNPDTVGSRILVWIVAIIIILVWLVIFALLIKMDVGGFGSTVLYPIAKDVPYLNRILPEVETYDEEEGETYATLDDALARIKELEGLLEDEKKTEKSLESDNAELQKEVNQLSEYKQNQEDFEILQESFYEEVVFGDEAPDIEEYKKYYEEINPEKAEALYKTVVAKMEKDSTLEDYVATYSNMKPKAAAAIFDTMGDDLGLVAKILRNMDQESRGDILAAMDVTLAARLTEILNP